MKTTLDLKIWNLEMLLKLHGASHIILLTKDYMKKQPKETQDNPKAYKSIYYNALRLSYTRLDRELRGKRY